MSEYHPCSNVGLTNSSLKRVMPEKLRAKGFGGQTNEALVKLIAYNLRVLAREVWMRDIPLDLPSEVPALEDCIRHVVDLRGHGVAGAGCVRVSGTAGLLCRKCFFALEFSFIVQSLPGPTFLS